MGSILWVVGAKGTVAGSCEVVRCCKIPIVHPRVQALVGGRLLQIQHIKSSNLFVTNLHVQGVRGRGVAGDGAAHVGRGGAGEGGVAGALRVNVVRRRFPLCTTGGEEVSELSFVSSWIQFWPCCGTYVNTRGWLGLPVVYY